MGNKQGGDDGSCKIAQPYQTKLTEIRGFVFNCIADFSCEEIKAERQYHKQSYAEKKRSQIFVRAGKIDCSAYGYRHACEQRTQKYVDNFFSCKFSYNFFVTKHCVIILYYNGCFNKKVALFTLILIFVSK